MEGLQIGHIDESGGTLHPIIVEEISRLYKIADRVKKLESACKIVVEGYEGDGMENMEIRDDVFYKYCKAALEN